MNQEQIPQNLDPNNIAPTDEVTNLFEQVDQQLANEQPATVLVERTSGDITTAQVAGIGESQTAAFFGDITDGPKKGMPYKPVGNEFLTDKYQEHLAEKLAGVALRGEGAQKFAEAEESRRDNVRQLEAELDAIKEQFPDDVRMNLWRYASATMRKADAQAAGDGNWSTQEGQEAGQAYRQLPESAKAVANKYISTIERLQNARRS